MMERKQSLIGQNDWISIALPIVLMITGMILLGGDYVGVLSLDSIQNLWPFTLIVVGLTELVPLAGGKES
jgi:hypothetical protein